MGDTKSFLVNFNARDNFSRVFDTFQKRMSAITGKTIPINFEVNKGITGNLDAIQKKVEAANMAASGWNNALGRAALGAKNAADATKNIGNETQKSTGFLGNMQSKLEGMGGVADRIRDKFGAITGLLAGGSIGGMSWLNAMTSEKADKSFERRMARRHIDTSTVDAFIDQAEGKGYTTKSARQDIADALLTRTSLRGSKMESTTKAIEDLYAQNSYDLNKKGITSAQDFADLLTKKTMGPGDKQALIDLGIKGTSVSSRLRGVQKLGTGIDESKLAAEDPYQSFLNRMSETSKKVGKTLIEPMNMVLEKVNGILDLVDTIPGAPGLIALAAVMTAAAGGASILLGVLAPLTGALKGLKAAEGAEKSLSGIQKLFGGGSSLSALMNPYVALAAIAAILLIVAYKTGVLQKAWDKFNQSAIGKDVMSGLKGLADFAGTLIDRFSKWYEDSGKNQMLSAFFTLVEVLGNAWDYVDKIYSTMTKGGANPLVAALTAISAAPLALGMGIAKTVTGKGPAELLGYLIEQDQRWISYLITNFPLFGKIYEIIKKVHSVMEWLYAMIQGALAWIRDGLGITKKEKEAKFEKTSMSIAEAHDKKVPYVWTTTEAGGSGWYPKGTVYTTGGVRPNEGLSDAEITRLNKAREAVEKAPKGFFEGVPGITDLTTALQNLLSPINNLIDALKVKDIANSANTIAEKVGFTGGTPAGKTPVVDDDKWEIWNSADSPDHFFIKSKTGDPRVPGQGDTYSRELVEKLYGAPLPAEGHAAGATFKRSGLFAGKVHSPEEIIPQAIASRGPGPIARAIAALDAATTDRSAAMGAVCGNISVSISAPIDLSGARISSNMDVEKIVARMRKEIKPIALEAVKDAIGQGRT